jgi:phage recombination protein Bet
MSTELMTSTSTSLNIWESEANLAQIKQIFAPKLSQLEFTIFVEMGKATQLNPFLREMWAIKYSEKEAPQIFIGRDGYRKGAQRHPSYDWHITEGIYSNDNFTVKNGEINHSFGMANRGTLLGAYCIVKRKDSSRAIHNIVELKEYNTGKSVWSGKPCTMIKKVAEAQALKSAFQDLFGGTYSEYEQFENNDINVIEVEPANKAASKVSELLQKKGLNNDSESNKDVIESSIVLEDSSIEAQTVTCDEPETVGETRKQKTKPFDKDDEKPITDELMDEISGWLHEKPLDADRMDKAMRYFEVENIEQMTIGKAKRFIELIQKT